MILQAISNKVGRLIARGISKPLHICDRMEGPLRGTATTDRVGRQHTSDGARGNTRRGREEGTEGAGIGDDVD